MNTINKTAQAATGTHAPIHVRVGRAVRSALFHTVHLTAWIAYFAWLLVPPVMWFSASPAHSHTATYWMAAIYLIAAGLMTWSGYIARVGFKVWQRDGDTWAGWWACGFSLPVFLAPTLPLLGLIGLISTGPRSDDEYWWASNPALNDTYGAAPTMGSFKYH